MLIVLIFCGADITLSSSAADVTRKTDQYEAITNEYLSLSRGPKFQM